MHSSIMSLKALDDCGLHFLNISGFSNLMDPKKTHYSKGMCFFKKHIFRSQDWLLKAKTIFLNKADKENSPVCSLQVKGLESYVLTMFQSSRNMVINVLLKCLMLPFQKYPTITILKYTMLLLPEVLHVEP